MGRHTAYTPELADEICERLSAGEPLAVICRDEHMPARATVYLWSDADPAFAGRIARAREDGHDAIADGCFAIVDEAPPTTATGGTDSGYVAWQKNRVWTRLQLLAKWNPKKYGDKQSHEITGANGGPLQVLDPSRLSDAAIAEIVSASKPDKP